MARSRALASVKSLAEAEYAEIIAWYERELASCRPPVGLVWQPVAIGPTWCYDNGWKLPDYTLGWRILAWCGKWLCDKTGQPWQFTPEQARFVLWYFAVEPGSGQFVYHSAVLQRLKGWGKDPIAACLAVAALFAEVTFDHWDGDVPMGRDEPSAWVQVVAVTQDQSKNTMKLFPSLISAAARAYYGVQVGKLNVYGLSDTRQIEAVTASPLAIEGGRPTLIVRSETQFWNSSNGGHAMAGAIEGNAAKSEAGAARMLDICNAYRPGESSVGERMREAWEQTQGIDAESDEFGLLYDSLEAPPEAPLSVEHASAVVESIRGDAYWLSTKRIVNSIMNPTNTASESRRKWYNQIVATEDARFDPLKLKLCATDDELHPGDEIVMFGDGSKSNDATGLVACRTSDGLCQVLHIQQPTKGTRVNRALVDLAVANAFSDYKVVGFWFDPSHTKDENAEGDERFWWPTCDEWAGRYGRRLTHWAIKTGNSRHAVAWDMTIATHQSMFVAAVEQLDADIESNAFRYHHSGWLRRHLENARAAPSKYGNGMQKNARESSHKIDLATCTVGARMLWRHDQLAKIANKRKGAPGSGRVVVLT